VKDPKRNSPHQNKKKRSPYKTETKTKKPKEMLSVGVFKINMRQTVDTPRGNLEKEFYGLSCEWWLAHSKKK